MFSFKIYHLFYFYKIPVSFLSNFIWIFKICEIKRHKLNMYWNCTKLCDVREGVRYSVNTVSTKKKKKIAQTFYLFLVKPFILNHFYTILLIIVISDIWL